MKAPLIDIPAGLETAYNAVVRLVGGANPDTIASQKLVAKKRSYSQFALQSFFVMWQDLYNGLPTLYKTHWTLYWETLPFGSHGGLHGYPGSGFSAFVYLNAPRYKANLDLILDPYPSPIIDAEQLNRPIGRSWGENSGQNQCAQSFIATQNCTLYSFTIMDYPQGAPTAFISCALYTDSGSNTPDTIIESSPTTFQETPFVTPVDWEFLFDDTNPSLVAGQKYWIVFFKTTPPDFLHNPAMAVTDLPNSYPDGRFIIGELGGTWSFNSSFPCAYFKAKVLA